MKQSSLLPTLLGLGFAAQSAAFTPMDQLSPSGSTNANLAVTTHNVMQIFPEFPTFNATVLDDFVMQGNQVVRVSTAFYFDLPGTVPANITGWHVGIYSTPIQASLGTGNFGTPLPGGVITANASNSTIVYTQLFGTGTTKNAYRVDITFNVPLVPLKPAGNPRLWFAMAPIMPFGTGGQIFTFENTSPFCSPGGSDGFWVNPGNGFGLGPLVPTGKNAPYEMFTL